VILIHQRYRQTDGRHAISIPRYALVHRAVKRMSFIMHYLPLSVESFCCCTGVRWVRRPRHQKLSPAVRIN